MIYNIQNNNLQVAISSLGAELQSIKKGEKEYLWQGSADSWSSKATNLFPFIGRCTDGKYIYQNNQYEMNSHGFVRNTDFQVEQISDSKIIFKTNHTNETIKIYPFKFEYQIVYELKNNSLQITHNVFNLDEKTMYFAIGGHPGFNIPFDDNLNFEDYYIEFCEEFDPKAYEIIQFNIGDLQSYPLKNNKILNLKHDLFDNDAIIFKNPPKTLCIKSDKSQNSIKVTYPQMEFLAVWHTPKKQTPFVCIEPWTSIPARHNIIEDIEKLEHFITLESNKNYTNSWEITI